MADARVRAAPPHRRTETIRGLAAAAEQAGAAQQADDYEETARKIAECDRKPGQYRTALDAGNNPATVAAWIAETEAEEAGYALEIRRPAPRRRMSEAEMQAIVDNLALASP